jgi:hypothetical protein
MPVTRGKNALPEDQANEARTASQREAAITIERVRDVEATNATLLEAYKKIERKMNTQALKQTVVTPKISSGDLDKISAAAKKGTMEGSSIVAPKASPKAAAAKAVAADPAPSQDRSLILAVVDRFREDSKSMVAAFREDSKFS